MSNTARRIIQGIVMWCVLWGDPTFAAPPTWNFFPVPGLTYTQTPSVFYQTGVTPVQSQQIDTSASTDTKNWMWRITGNAIPSTLHALTCTGALVCTDWLTVTRADAVNPGIADSVKLFTSSAGFETSLAISPDLIELKAAESGDATDVVIGTADIDFFGNLDGDTLFLVDNQNTGTGAFAHFEIGAAGGGLFEFSLVPPTATLITSNCSGLARNIVCLSTSAGTAVIGLAGSALGATMIEGAGGLVADTQTHATADTNGFFYMPKVAGVPTGTPANLATYYANGTPMRYDGTDNRLYAYNSGWQNLTFSPVNPQFSGHISFTGTAPGVSACGTGPSIDAHATDATGTVTVGTVAAASCTVTFNVAYATWNHCRITSQSTIASFAYSYTLAAITVTGTSLVGDQFDYDCDGS